MIFCISKALQIFIYKSIVFGSLCILYHPAVFSLNEFCSLYPRHKMQHRFLALLHLHLAFTPNAYSRVLFSSKPSWPFSGYRGVAWVSRRVLTSIFGIPKHTCGIITAQQMIVRIVITIITWCCDLKEVMSVRVWLIDQVSCKMVWLGAKCAVLLKRNSNQEMYNQL